MTQNLPLHADFIAALVLIDLYTRVVMVAAVHVECVTQLNTMSDVNEKKLADCSDCSEFPCTQLIHFCYNPVWMHHFPVIENLKRRRMVGMGKLLEEQKQFWQNEWYRRAWLWFQRECEERLKRYIEESKKSWKSDFYLE